ncbi:MAG: reverse transcriptase domain-containing protein, partial [Pseudomonadota bacterium]
LPPASASDHPPLPGPTSVPLSASHPNLHPLTPPRPSAPNCPTNLTSSRNPLPDLPISYLNDNQFINQDSFLVTDLTNTLTEEEKRLLSKGPKFALGQSVNDKTNRDTTINFCRLANELRWKEHRRRSESMKESNNETNMPNYPYKDEIAQPPKYPDFERKLARINETITKCLNSVERGRNSNLLPTERKTLAQLKNKNFRYLPSDKGGEFCVIENERYVDIGKEHLNDSEIYSRIATISTKTIELRVNKVWKEIAKKNNLNFNITRRYVSTNTDLAHFYFLIKTHKLSNSLKIRPIVSNINCPTTKISWLLDKALKPLIEKVPAHLENTSDLLKRLESLNDKAMYSYPVSLDVVSLYTSIPQKGVVDVVYKIMSECSYSFHELHPGDIVELLNVVLNNNYFIFEGGIYKQNHGLAMGSSVSAILAILYMGHIESIALNKLSFSIGLYARYVDDVFLLTKCREEAEKVYACFNSIDPNIKFEIEHPSTANNIKTLRLLDVAIHVEETGVTHYEFYKKEARKPIFVNFRSSLPT